MEKNRATVARGDWILIVPDFQHPFIGAIAQPHPLLLKPSGHIPGIDDDVAIVVGVLRIIHIRIPFADLMIRPETPLRRSASVSEQHP